MSPDLDVLGAGRGGHRNRGKSTKIVGLMSQHFRETEQCTQLAHSHSQLY